MVADHGSDKIYIVKEHGGELKVETGEGEGSTFIIQL
jgi:signal transduction histidine kinase